jgi:hypothetical protein
MTDALHFDAESHRYTVGDDPTPWAHITGVLGAAGLTNYESVPDDVLDRARDRGSKVARALHYYGEGDLDVATLDPALVPYVQSWATFCARYEFRPHPDYIERPLVHRAFRYAGTPDVAGWWRDDDGTEGFAVIERKAVAQVQFAATWPQVAAQDLLLATDPALPHPRTRLIVNLKATGEPAVHRCTPREAATHTGHWFAALNLYFLRQRHGLL